MLTRRSGAAASPGNPERILALPAAFLILFLATLLVMSLVTIAVAEFVKTLGLVDGQAVLGASFGLAAAC